MDKLSVIYPYFHSERMLSIHLNTWDSYPDYIKEKINFIVIDDCSDPPMHIPEMNLNLKGFRILDNIKWNQPGVRNLGATVAETDWLLFADTDMVISADIMVQVFEREFDPEKLYNFQRKRMSNPNVIHHKIHKCTAIMTKNLFWNIGLGYDEDFCGEYGFDDSFFFSFFEKERWVTMEGLVVTEYDKEFLEDDGTPLVRNPGPNKKLFREKRKDKYTNHSRDYIRFSYMKVYDYLYS